MKKRILALVLGAVMTASVIAGCGGGSSSGSSNTSTNTAGGNDTAAAAETGAPAEAAAGEETDAEPGEMVEGGEFIKGVSTEVSNFDPFIAQTADARSIFFNIYEGLMNTETDGSFVGAIAESYERSDDMQTYTFTLRDGVKFHNGNEVTMEDVTSSIQRAIDGQITGFDEIESFEAADDKTLVIKLNAPDSGFLAIVTSPIVPADAEDLATNPIGTGPFQVSEVEEQDYILLTRFEDYWGEPAHLDSVRLKYFENTSELATNFIAGAIDGYNANAGGYRELSDTDFVKNTRHSNAVQLLALNNDFEPFKDVRVRQAIAYAVDADDIIETVSYGDGTKCGTPMIPALEKYFNDELTNVYDVDVDKAKELLKEAGQENLSFTIRVPSNYQVHMDTAQLIVNQLAAAGITMEIEAVDWSTWLEKVYTNRDYEATIVSVDGPTAFPTSFLSRYVSTASNDFVNFKSEEFDKVYGEAVLCADEEEQIKLFKEAQKIISDECASVYIQDIDTTVITSTDFAGFASYPLYVDDYSVMYMVQ